MGDRAFGTLIEYVDATGMKKNRVATNLGLTPQQFSALLQPDVYRPRVDDSLVAKIADLLNQSCDYVRSIYPRAA